MPTYCFKCIKCEHSFEELLKMAERELPINQPCPSCGENQCIETVLSAPNLVSPFAISGLKKPQSDFRERMNQIKENHKNAKSLDGKIKDY